MYVVLCFIFLVVSSSAIDCLERLVSEMTYYVSGGTLNPTHSLTHSHLTICDTPVNIQTHRQLMRIAPVELKQCAEYPKCYGRYQTW